MGTMDPQTAQDIIDGNTKKDGKGGSVISEPLGGFAQTVIGGLNQGIGEVYKDVNNALGGGKGKSIEDILKAAGASPDQIKAIMGTLGGSGGSGGSGGGGFAAPDPMESALFNTYFTLWGKKPPPGVIQNALKQGLNVFQFEDQIRQDPAFKHTETYQNEMADNVLSLARQLGFLPG